jgi:hypothetical protein
LAGDPIRIGSAGDQVVNRRDVAGASGVGQRSEVRIGADVAGQENESGE